MSTLVPIPRLGQSEETVKIEKWRVKEGDAIKKGYILFEVETDKAVLEVESQFEGTLLKIVVPEGIEVPVMSTAAVLGQPGEKIPDIKPEKVQTAKKELSSVKIANAPAKASAAGASRRIKFEHKTEDIAGHTFKETISGQFRKPNPSPRARSFAKNYLIDIEKVSGTGGASGRVAESDVKRYIEESGYLNRKITDSAFNLARKEGLFLPDIEGTGERGMVTLSDAKNAAAEKPKELSTMRKIIAKRLSDSKKNIPHFYLTVSVDMTDVKGLRKTMKDDGSAVSINDFVIKAAALSLRAFPMMNAECDGLKAVRRPRINIGVAVSLENGLVVPVVKNADKKALDEIHAEVEELAEAARAGKLSPEKMKGGTFTISNMGMLGVENFAAIINPGESAILAVSASVPTPVARNGKIEIREMMKITVSADHRIVDGSDAAKFANAVKSRLEKPSQLIPESAADST
jgi:pyruvate dehydrogenase E2 component (dihydrolipoamide acetyltransferase)